MKMKDYLIVFCMVLVIVLGVSFFSPLNKGAEEAAGQSTNRIENFTFVSTSTDTSLPILIMGKKSNRTYALITNNSDTAVYLYPGNFASGLAASTTVATTTGIRLAANGGSYEINDQNLYIGQIWATSTSASKNIISIEN